MSKRPTGNTPKSDPPKAAEHLWQPGQSGNPAGRPKQDVKLKELCRSLTEEAVNALKSALTEPKERARAAEILLAYGHGRPAQTINVRKIRSIEDLDDDELAALAGDGLGGDALGVEHDGTRH